MRGPTFCRDKESVSAPQPREGKQARERAPGRGKPPLDTISMTVVNSPDVKWKAVDRIAARVIFPASWYCRPLMPKETEDIKYELERLINKERTFDAQRQRRDERARANGTFTAISDAEIQSVANKRKKLAFQIEQLCNILSEIG